MQTLDKIGRLLPRNRKPGRLPLLTKERKKELIQQTRQDKKRVSPSARLKGGKKIIGDGLKVHPDRFEGRRKEFRSGGQFFLKIKKVEG